MELFHVLNRGVEKREIFMSTGDYARFVHNMYEFNDVRPAANAGRLFKTHTQMNDLRNPSFERKKIIEIHGWCLMKNHYHLLMSERLEGGLTKFLRKINVGYANYFNEKYGREGSLFQGRTKKKLVDSDAYFLHILTYIHLNPLDYLPEARDWRERAVRNAARAQKHLEGYRWSSYNDYCGRKNFPSILNTSLFSNSPAKFEKETLQYLKDIETSTIKDYLLE